MHRLRRQRQVRTGTADNRENCQIQVLGKLEVLSVVVRRNVREYLDYQGIVTEADKADARRVVDDVFVRRQHLAHRIEYLLQLIVGRVIAQPQPRPGHTARASRCRAYGITRSSLEDTRQ